MKQNLLPFDGEVFYRSDIFNGEISDHYLSLLLDEIAWQNDEAIIYGKHIFTKRKVAWYADAKFEYSYSKITRTAKIWNPILLEIKNRVEASTGNNYNSCLLNLYHNGMEGMAWHSDAEKELEKNGSIASVSFGAARKFMFKHKNNGERVDVWLENGGVLLMEGPTQEHWLHRLPVSKRVLLPRVNLTFRKYVGM